MRKVVYSFIALLILISSNLFSQKANDYTYIGAKKCKMCHNKAKTGIDKESIGLRSITTLIQHWIASLKKIIFMKDCQ